MLRAAYGGAKDPVNFAGMVASNVVRGDMKVALWQDLGSTSAFVLDVREPHEFRAGSIDGAVNIPLGELRTRIGELPRSKEIWVNCQVGQRAYYACRIPNGMASACAIFPADTTRTGCCIPTECPNTPGSRGTPVLRLALEVVHVRTVASRAFGAVDDHPSGCQCIRK